MKLVKFLSVGLVFVLASAAGLVSAENNPTAIHIQRTMKALEESTAENPAHLRVMFYGQSITAQRWTQEVEQFFREKYPTPRPKSSVAGRVVAKTCKSTPGTIRTFDVTFTTRLIQRRRLR